MTLQSVSGDTQRDFQHGDPKPMGAFGAPSCHCTSIVLALCVSLCGFVLAGTGACVSGFLWHDTTPKILGLALIALGLIMVCAGFVMFLYDAQSKKRKLAESANSLSGSDMQMQSTQSGAGIFAPPSYDDVLQENVRYRDDATNSRNERVSYFTAVRTAKVNSTTAV